MQTEGSFSDIETCGLLYELIMFKSMYSSSLIIDCVEIADSVVLLFLASFINEAKVWLIDDIMSSIINVVFRSLKVVSKVPFVFVLEVTALINLTLELLHSKVVIPFLI